MLYIPERPHRSVRLRELENLQKHFNDLEIELSGQNRRRDQEGLSDDPDGSSRGNGSRRLRSYHEFPSYERHWHCYATLDAMSRALVKRVMVDQGSGAEIMYPNLYKGLGLKSEDLSRYDTPLVGFNGKIITLEGQINLSVVIEGKEVEVDFIVVNDFSPYTTILG